MSEFLKGKDMFFLYIGLAVLVVWFVGVLSTLAGIWIGSVIVRFIG